MTIRRLIMPLTLAVIAVGVAIVDAAPGEHIGAGREGHRPLPAEHVHLGACARPRADQHDCGRIARVHGGQPPLEDVPGPGGDLSGDLQPVQAVFPSAASPPPTAVGPPTSAISSTSTGASSGSTATPTALRACLPAAPKISVSRSLAPFTT